MKRFVAILILSLLATPVVGQTCDVLRAEQATYLGVIGPPKLGNSDTARFGYGMFGMDFAPNCLGQPDPSPDDGYPGCIIATSHKNADMVGLFDIVPPVLGITDHSNSSYMANVPRGQLIGDFWDPSQGIRAILDQEPGWVARDIPGVAVFDNENKLLVTCGHDWYDVNDTDYKSHCVYDVASGTAEGAWGYDASWATENDLHSQKMAWYVDKIPQNWADMWLNSSIETGREWCVTGMQRAGGGKPSMGAGPNMFAIPCHSDDPPMTELENEARVLIQYPNVNPKRPSGYLEPLGVPDGHSVITQTKDIAWVDDTSIVVSRTRGGALWWYGHRSPYEEPRVDEGILINHRTNCDWNGGDPIWGPNTQNPGQPCGDYFLDHGPAFPPGTMNDPDSIANIRDYCSNGKGYHAVQSFDPGVKQVTGELLFYAVTDVERVLNLQYQWGDPRPVSVMDLTPYFWDNPYANGLCDKAMAVTYDPVNDLLYVVQENKELPIIHVFYFARPCAGDGEEPGGGLGGTELGG